MSTLDWAICFLLREAGEQARERSPCLLSKLALSSAELTIADHFSVPRGSQRKGFRESVWRKSFNGGPRVTPGDCRNFRPKPM